MFTKEWFFSAFLIAAAIMLTFSFKRTTVGYCTWFFVNIMIMFTTYLLLSYMVIRLELRSLYICIKHKELQKIGLHPDDVIQKEAFTTIWEAQAIPTDEKADPSEIKEYSITKHWHYTHRDGKKSGVLYVAIKYWRNENKRPEIVEKTFYNMEEWTVEEKKLNDHFINMFKNIDPNFGKFMEEQEQK